MGIDKSFLKNKHGPCPVCGGKDRFRFDNKNGKGTFFCNQCGAGDGITLLCLYHEWGFKEALHAIATLVDVGKCIIAPQTSRPLEPHLDSIQEEAETRKRRKSLRTVWMQSKKITSGDPVDRYLRNRGIFLNEFPSILRFHPTLPYYHERNLVGKYNALLALIQNKVNQAVTIHRTYLENGYQANVPKTKKLMSPITPGASLGAAIKLFAPKDGRLVVAEGIETALCFHIATQLPVWATVSANGMEKVIVPDAVKETIIAVDNDISGRGQRAANKLKKRLLDEGRAVKYVIPPNVGDDFADMLMGVVR